MSVPKKHHLDKRAHRIIEDASGNPDDLLTTKQVADWLLVSTEFLEIARHKKIGPRFLRLSARNIRYKRADVLAWLRSRTHAGTVEYIKRSRTKRATQAEAVR